MITRTSWYRPNDAVGFYPSTPNGELAKIVQTIVDEETQRLNMKVKIVQTGGVSLVRQLVKTDLSGCLIPNCYVCECNIPGASHNRSGVVYNVKCIPCQEKGINASYEGESGDNLAYRKTQHADSVKY